MAEHLMQITGSSLRMSLKKKTAWRLKRGDRETLLKGAEALQGF
jgi:hypothetical protein